jgi:hypothetical protein
VTVSPPAPVTREAAVVPVYRVQGFYWRYRVLWPSGGIYPDRGPGQYHSSQLSNAPASAARNTMGRSILVMKVRAIVPAGRVVLHWA